MASGARWFTTSSQAVQTKVASTMFARSREIVPADFLAEYERALANFTSAEKTMRTTELLGARRADLEALMAEWEQVSQTIEANR